ncbi:MAG: DUF3139 domain-containing protein [Oscillospiraceae bacterium]|nr:DUF3139 domain-containing protein [Oscillospiraceae bacterium]
MDSENKKRTIFIQITLMCVGSLVATLLLFDVTSAIVGGLGIISLLSLILIPILFAFPMLIKRRKLIIIPSILFPVLITSIIFVFFHPYDRLFLIPTFFVIVIVAALPGIAAGFLINLLREKKKNKIFITLMCICTIIPTLYIGYVVQLFFLGNPVGSSFVYLRIRAYVSEQFPDDDLVVRFPQYCWKGNLFETTIVFRDDENVSFRIIYWGGGRISDFYDDITFNQVANILEKEFGEEFVRVQLPPERGIPYPYRNKLRVSLYLESLDHYRLSEIITRTWELTEENDFEFEGYGFNFFSNTDQKTNVSRLTTIHHLHPQHITDSELLELIKDIYENYISTGRYRIFDYTFEGIVVTHR